MADALNRLTAEVAEQKTVIAGAVTLLATLSQQIRDNIGNDDALNALADDLDLSTNQLATAIEANTIPSDQPQDDDGAVV